MPHDAADFAAWVYRDFGHDFRQYRLGTLGRRLRHLCAGLHLDGLAALRDWLASDPRRIDYVVDQLCVPVSQLFREPGTLGELRRLVFPALSSFPAITVWHAGCAAGQEAYSMAILLDEAGLLPRSRIFASDISAGALAQAARGLVPAAQLGEAAPRHRASGGTGDLARHFTAQGDQMRLSRRLMSHISFVRHNLATDAVFCEANLILCCNVLIYFERPLQCRALELFSDSLVRGGHLCLGQRETPIGAGGRFAPMPGSRWIYRPTAQPRPPLVLPFPPPDERIP
ncbi:CheR family methyltransferase [Paracoccus sp. DMF]|uniref:CheR family methyltransferase n=1 Tax=Paracoccus sp. DMF TaxID=400837 RepID=UPI0021E3CB40|nr:protein-glutamate O-methyltransferase CheR [Paracoccus sp. DMF]MCV2446210.1 protein-glutamate O-methyltransferase CheR [Paracoccus sp. DMF]